MRIAGPEDLEEAVALVLEFISKTEHIKKYSTEEYVRTLVSSILNADKKNEIFIMDEGCFLAGKAIPFPYGPAIIATELGWYVREDNRGLGLGKDMLEAFEYWAKEIAGAQVVNMGSIDDSVGEYYIKKGYVLSERAYIKEL